jgi:hypothetical protein
MRKHLEFWFKLELACVAVVACLGAGCATIPIMGLAGPAARYLGCRANDALDIFEVGVEAGPGFRVDAKYAIGMAGVGTGGASMFRLGQRRWRLYSRWEEFAPVPFPLGLPLALMVWPIEKLAGAPPGELGVYLIGGEREEELLSPRAAVGATVIERCGFVASGGTRFSSAWGRWFTVGAEVMLGVGGRARVYPVEVLDFVTGLVGWDLLGDDAGIAVRLPLMPEVGRGLPSQTAPPASPRGGVSLPR